MNDTLPVGRAIFAAGIVLFGVQNLLLGNFLPELQPVPAWVPGRTLLAYLTGAILVGAGLSLLVGKIARRAAVVIALMLLLWVLVLHVPRVILNPRAGNAWTPALEIFAIAAAAWVLAGVSSRASNDKWNLPEHTAAIGRFCFALTLPGFGLLHFIYRDYVASVIPAWIPAHMFWAYATGVAHIAAGISIATNTWALLAARLATVMFGTWALILHIPRAMADVNSRAEWTSLFVATAFCGGAWIIAESLARVERSADRRTRPDAVAADS